jgi:hypothetical protein
MTKRVRLLLAAATLTSAALAGATSALACGNSRGYSYASFSAASRAFGISATITPLDTLDVLNGHVAAWVGVGGPGEGPNGTNEWLQIGYAGFPSITGSDIYYEVALPDRFPTYQELAAGVPTGTPGKVTVLEMYGRPNWWRVWLNHKPVSPPIFLPQSDHRWTPTVTAENWDGGTGGTCNTFPYGFSHVSIAHAPGGGWRQIQSAATRLSAIS